MVLGIARRDAADHHGQHQLDAYAAAAVGWATGVVRFELSATPNIAAWLQRCMEREGAKQMK